LLNTKVNYLAYSKFSLQDVFSWSIVSFVGRVFFSCVSACFNFVLSNLVTSCKSGLSDIFKGALRIFPLVTCNLLAPDSLWPQSSTYPTMYELLASLLNATANHRRARDTKCQKGRCQLRQNKKILSIQSRHTIDSAKCPLSSFRRHIDSIFKHLEKVEKSFRWSCHVFERNWGKILPKISAVGGTMIDGSPWKVTWLGEFTIYVIVFSRK